MAFGALFHGGYSTKTERNVDIYVDRNGYGGTTYEVDVQSDRLTIGQSSGALFAPTRRSRSAVRFLADDTALDEAKQISRKPYGTHRVRVEHNGTQVYKGFVEPRDTTTPIEGPLGSFTVRAKVGLEGLSSDWRTPSGSLFSGEFKLSVILADIFDAIGLGAPIDAVLQWRPSSMSAGSDPLAIKAQAAAWQRDNSEGQTQVLSRREVISDVVGVWAASIFFEDGTWRIRQPTAYKSATSVTVHEYDATGAHLGTSTRTATTDISGDPWDEQSDEVSGVTTLQSAEIEFEHGAPAAVDFNGSFEDGPANGADGWTFPTADFGIAPDSANSDSDRSLEIIGDAYLTNSASTLDMKQAVGEIAKATLGGYAAGSEEVTLELQYKSKLNPNSATRGTDTPAEIALYYQVSHISISGTTYWFVEGSGWVEQSNLSTFEERLNELQTGPAGSTWLTKTVTLPSPPQVGSMELGLAEPISRKDTSGGSDYDYAGYWDECALDRAVTGSAVTLFRSWDPSLDDGDTLERTLRIGDGPYEGSPGALKTPSGDFTGSWQVIGQNSTYALHELLAKELMAALRGGAQLIRSEFREPTRPLARRAVQFDSLRSWPVQVDWDVVEETYTTALVQLRDEGYPPEFVKIAGGEDSFDSPAGSGGTSPPTTVETWDQITGKPGGLFAAGGDSDGYPSTQALPEAIGSFAAGAVRSGKVMLRYKLESELDLTRVRIDAESAPASDVTFSLLSGSGTQFSKFDGITLPSAGNTASKLISQTVAAGDVIKVVCAQNDSGLSDVSVTLDATR